MDVERVFRVLVVIPEGNLRLFLLFPVIYILCKIALDCKQSGLQLPHDTPSLTCGTHFGGNAAGHDCA